MNEQPQEEIPLTPESAFVRLQKWFLAKQELTAAKVAEHLERVRLSSFYFHDPREGTNRLEISPGYDLKLVHGYNYKVDEAALDNVDPKDIKKFKLPWDDLFRWKPELVTKTYRTLTPEQKAFVDQYLEVTDASPQLEIVAGKSVAPTADDHPQRRATDYDASADAAVAGTSAALAADTIGDFDIVVEDMDAAQPGNYYCDADNDWWIVGADGDWSQCDAPTNLPPPVAPAPKRRGRGK